MILFLTWAALSYIPNNHCSLVWKHWAGGIMHTSPPNVLPFNLFCYLQLTLTQTPKITRSAHGDHLLPTFRHFTSNFWFKLVTMCLVRSLCLWLHMEHFTVLSDLILRFLQRKQTPLPIAGLPGGQGRNQTLTWGVSPHRSPGESEGAQGHLFFLIFQCSHPGVLLLIMLNVGLRQIFLIRLNTHSLTEILN